MGRIYVGQRAAAILGGLPPAVPGPSPSSVTHSASPLGPRPGEVCRGPSPVSGSGARRATQGTEAENVLELPLSDAILRLAYTVGTVQYLPRYRPRRASPCIAHWLSAAPISSFPLFRLSPAVDAALACCRAARTTRTRRKGKRRVGIESTVCFTAPSVLAPTDKKGRERVRPLDIIRQPVLHVDEPGWGACPPPILLGGPPPSGATARGCVCLRVGDNQQRNLLLRMTARRIFC